MNKIEIEYNKMIDSYEHRKKNNDNERGVDSVLQYMLDNPNKIWWWAWEFIGKKNSKGNYLSHRSPARASDLAIHYPEFVEHRKIGRFKVYRLKVENIKNIKEFLQ